MLPKLLRNDKITKEISPSDEVMGKSKIKMIQCYRPLCSHVDDFDNRNIIHTINSVKVFFTKFYYRHSELIVKYNICLRTLLQRGISEPVFLWQFSLYILRIVGNPNCIDQIKTIIKHYKRVGYNMDIMRQSACLVVNHGRSELRLIMVQM